MIAESTQVAVTLEPQQWQQVLGLLSEVAAPWRVTNPLLQAIAAQVGQQQQQMAPVHQLRPVEDPGRA